MELSKGELRMIAILPLIATQARPVGLAVLKRWALVNRVFHRGSLFEEAKERLGRMLIIATDDEWQTVYLLAGNLQKLLDPAAVTGQGHFHQTGTLAGALAEVDHERHERDEKGDFREGCAESAHGLSIGHLGNAGEKSFLQLPSGQMGGGEFSQKGAKRREAEEDRLKPGHRTGAEKADGAARPSLPAEKIVAWLERTVEARGDAADSALWLEWAGWWHTVARNNPDRIERAYEKALRVPDLRKPERYMRNQIAGMVKEGMG